MAQEWVVGLEVKRSILPLRASLAASELELRLSPAKPAKITYFWIVTSGRLEIRVNQDVSFKLFRLLGSHEKVTNSFRSWHR